MANAHPLVSVTEEVICQIQQTFPAVNYQHTQKYKDRFIVHLSHGPSEPTEVSIRSIEQIVHRTWPHSSVEVVMGGYNPQAPTVVKVTLRNSRPLLMPGQLVGLVWLFLGTAGLLL